MSDLPDHIQRAIRSGPVPQLRDWRAIIQDNRANGRPETEGLTRAEKNMACVEKYCVVPEGTLVGQPLQLDTFQQAFYYALYDNPAGTYEAHLSIARKNSKTATIATIVIVHLVGPEAALNSEIMSGARSREQASQVFRYASKMVQMSQALSQRVRIVPSSKILYGLACGVEYKAGAAEASTSIGSSPILAILDELGQVQGPRDDYVDAITTAQGAHDDPLLVGISTQAASDSDLWSVWLDDAHQGNDDSVVSHVYEIPSDADIYDENNWVYANPALGNFRSLKDMRRMANKASRMPSFENTFRNYYCNQRVEANDPFITVTLWRENGDPPRPDWSGLPVYAGLDLSSTRDLTALVLCAPDDEFVHVQPYFWLPGEGLAEKARQDRVPYDQWREEGHLLTTPGSAVEYRHVAQFIAQLLGELDIRRIAFDRWQIRHLWPWLNEAGLDDDRIDELFVEFGQGYRDMSPALRDLETSLLNGKIKHGEHPILNMCATNAVVKADEAGNRKLDKRKSTRRIDGMVALTMAHGVMPMETEPAEIERGVITI